jgi:enhancing lycopene biosynthesis protein 2
MKKIGVMLSGCGVFDGAEIHESTLTLLSIDQQGAQAVCMAPDIDFDVVNHLNQQADGERRNVLVESARIARGDIQNAKDVSAQDLDALIFPGGFGAAKNLSDFAMKGADATVHPEIQRILDEMMAAKKPIGAICIAPATVAKALGSHQITVTIGNDTQTANAIEQTGSQHSQCSVENICIDDANNIITTPAYMLGPGIKDVAIGIHKLVVEVINRA